MSKDPAMLWYPNDYIGGTMGMSFEEKGAYMEILMMQFNVGHMTSHMIGQTVGQLWDKVKHKFIQDDNGLWYNERVQEEKEKRQKYVNSRKNNKKGVNQYTKGKKNKGHMTSHMIGHMENENENENKAVDKEKELEKRMMKFSDSLEGFKEKYQEPMIIDFYRYWTEPNKSKTKMRFEMEKTWHTGRRLSRWESNFSTWKKTSRSSLPQFKTAAEKEAEAIERIAGK